MFHNPIWKRAIAFIIIFSIVSSSFAGELSLPSDKRWIMIASRSTFEEAKQLADYYKQNFKGTAIFYTPNGKDNLPWYPITIGYVPYPAGTATLSKLIADGTIPSDSYLASGNKFTTLPNLSQTNTTNSTTNSASNSDGAAALLGLLAIGAVLYAIGSTASSSNSDDSNSHSSENNPFDRGTYRQTTNPFDRDTYRQTTNPFDRKTYTQTTNPFDRETYRQTTNPFDRETYQQGPD